jgi:hypothetical protein
MKVRIQMRAKTIFKSTTVIKIKELKNSDHISRAILRNIMDLMVTLTMELSGETHTIEKFQITMLIQKLQTHLLLK